MSACYTAGPVVRYGNGWPHNALHPLMLISVDTSEIVKRFSF